MSHECDAAAGLRTPSNHPEGADQLEHEPETDRYIAGHIGEHSEHDDGDPPVRVKDEIAAHHTGDRSGRTETGYERVFPERERRRHVGQRSRNPRREIKGQISRVREIVLDVVTENPEKQHVAEQMHQAAVHEHRCQQCDVHADRRVFERDDDSLIAKFDSDVLGDVCAGANFLRDRGKGVGERLVRADSLSEIVQDRARQRLGRVLSVHLHPVSA